MVQRLVIQSTIFLLILVASITSEFIVREEKFSDDEEKKAEEFLKNIDVIYAEKANSMQLKNWDYLTNIRNESQQERIQEISDFENWKGTLPSDLSQYNWRTFTSDTLRRAYEFLNISGTTSQARSGFEEIETKLETAYNEAKICEMNNKDACTLELNQDLINIMATSTDYEMLKYVWKEWRDKTGKLFRKDYLDLVKLNNEAATLNGYDDMGSLRNAYYLYEGYTEDQFREDLKELYETVKPLYQELFTYVRRILADHVYPDNVNRYGSLPAHILGNMWAQSWGNIGSLVMPYVSASVNATPQMIEQDLKAEDLFKKSEKFYTDLGLGKMSDGFWENSVLTKSKDSEVACQGSAQDFYKDEDYRILMCTSITQQDLVAAHHLMGHIQYFTESKDQYSFFRKGANPGFPEAVGGAIGLSISTPEHLKKIGLISEEKVTGDEARFENLPELPNGFTAQDMNYLLQQALDKVAFLPFGYLVDEWRWSVFNGSTTTDTLNTNWWTMRENLQGIKAPEKRTESDFDPGSKFHIAADVEYIGYFVGHILQFQFYEALCTASGVYDPLKPETLYKCDFDGKEKAGDKLKALMASGLSKPWPDVLEEMTGTRSMDATSLLTYFKPLQDWLHQANINANDCIGWDDGCEGPPIDNTVPIVVGSILAILVLVVIVAYFIGRAKSRKKEDTSIES